MSKKACTKCGKVKDSEKDFYPYRNRKGEPRVLPRCKDCSKAISTAWQRENRDKVNQREREKGRTEEQKLQRRLKMYGLTEIEFVALEAAHQDLCAICKESLVEKSNIDHNHDNGAVRGLLCTKCNTGLGAFRDSPALLVRAALYLKDRKHGIFAEAS